MLDDAIILETESVEDVGAHRATRRRMTHEGTVIGAGAGHTEPDGVAVDGEVVDGEMEVGEGALQRRDDSLDTHRPGSVVRLFAADIVLRLERAAPLVTIVAGASRSHAELAELLAALHADRLRNLRVLVDALAANGPLRLEEDEALETVWALTSPELHQLLVRVRGWTRQRYRDWLATSLAALLLPEGRPGTP